LKKDYEKFQHKYESICEMRSSPGKKSNKEYVSFAYKRVEAEPADLIDTLNKLVPCIGCRTSVERFYTSLIEMNRSEDSILDPFSINENGNLSLSNAMLSNPLSIYKLFYING